MVEHIPMNLDSTALVVEGGGLRGVYAAGVLRYFMQRRLFIPYVIGVSSGACNCANYISRQPERNRIVNIDYVRDRRYINYFRWLRTGELFGLHFLFHTLPFDLEPYDFDAFTNSGQRLLVTVTDCMSGKALYLDRHTSHHRFLKALRASCSLPMLSHPVNYDGMVLMDGGLSDSVPLEKSISDGNQKHILILTQPKGYRKNPSRLTKVVNLRYKELPGLCKAASNRHIAYNRTMDQIDRMESRGDVFVIRPASKLTVGRVERNQDRLSRVYEQGYADGKMGWDGLCAYLNSRAAHT